MQQLNFRKKAKQPKSRVVLKENTFQFKNYTKIAEYIFIVFTSNYLSILHKNEILLGKHVKMHNLKKESRESADTVTHLCLQAQSTERTFRHPSYKPVCEAGMKISTAYNGCFWGFLSKKYLRQISILITNE